MPRRLYIAEKPSAARALCEALGPARKIRPCADSKVCGHFEGDGFLVAALSGHFYTLWEPEDYDQEKWGRWSLGPLPFIVREPRWKVITKSDRLPPHEIQRQIDHIKSLYTDIDEVVIATDAEQEGQVIGQVFVEQTGWSGKTLRFWTDLWEVESVREGLRGISDNALYSGYYEAGVARALLDFLIGINFTRLFTLKAEMAGYDFTANAGRVRSAAAAIVVDHDAHVRAHTAREYYSIECELASQDASFKAKIVLPDTLCEDKKHCFDLQAINGIYEHLKPIDIATVLEVANTQSSTPPPAPFNQNTLSQFCADQFGLMPHETLEIAQNLYEEGFLSYPRTESVEYEPKVLDKIPGIFKALSQADPDFKAAIDAVDIQVPRNVFNAEGVNSHSALYVSSLRPAFNKWNEITSQVYRAVASNMICQFASDLVMSNQVVSISIGNQRFRAKTAAVKSPGWTQILPREQKDDDALPPLTAGDVLKIQDITVVTQKTKAPPHLTVKRFQAILEDCTHLLSPTVKKHVGHGQLGTGATQPYYLTELVKQGVAHIKDKEYVLSTKRGRQLRDMLPSVITSPDLTSIWEVRFRSIRAKEHSAQEFINSVIDWLEPCIRDSLRISFKASPTAVACEKCGCAMNRRDSKNNPEYRYWTCSNEDCHVIVADRDGRPLPLHPKDGESCPECQSILRTRGIKSGQGRSAQITFLACSNKECNYTEDKP